MDMTRILLTKYDKFEEQYELDPSTSRNDRKMKKKLTFRPFLILKGNKSLI